MTTFPQAVEGWHDFYITIGTAATLMGLLILSRSLNADMIRGKTNKETK